MVDRSDDIDDGWNSDEPEADRPSNVGNDVVRDKVDTAKNRLARIDDRPARLDKPDEAPPSRPLESRTVPPPSGYDEVRRTSKRQAFDLEAALERRALREGTLPNVQPAPTAPPPVSPSPPSTTPFFAAGDLPPLPPSTQAPPTLLDDTAPPRRSLAPIIVAVTLALALGIALYALTTKRVEPPTAPLASATITTPTPSPPPPPTPPSPATTVEPAVEHAQPAIPPSTPSPRTATAPSPPTPTPTPTTTTPTTTSAPSTPKPSTPSAPAPAHTPSGPSTAAPGVEFLKRNL